MTPIQASLEENEGYVHMILIDKRKKNFTKISSKRSRQNSKFEENIFKRRHNKWSYKLYKITEVINDTILTYHMDNLPERYNESLLKKTELSLKQNKDVMKALNSN